jgi:N-acetylglucosamine-6-sulfatase
MGEHGIKEEKRWAYEPSIRVPMLMRYPRLIPAGSERNQNVLNIDIAPTLLDLAGVKSPTPMHGSSLLPVFRNSDAPLRDSFLCEYFLEKFVPGVPDWQSVSQGKWKYIHYPALTGMDELYDVSADPAEEKNVIGEASNREVLSQMKSELNRLLAASQANLSMV